MKPFTAIAGVCLLVLAGLPSVGLGASGTWVGGTSSNWNNAANWSGGVLPSGAWPDGIATINTNSPNVCTITASLSATPSDIFIGSGSSANTGRVDHISGSVSNGTGNWLFVGIQGAKGTYNLADTTGSGGTFTGFAQGSGSLTVGGSSTTSGRLTLGADAGGTGTLNMNSSGTLTFRENLRCGGNGTGASGTINLDAGTINTAVELQLGWGTSGSTGTMNQSGGTNNIGSYLAIGRDTGNSGTYNLTGGRVNASQTGGFAVMGSFSGSTGTLNVSGTGVFNVAGNRQLIVGEGGTGTLNVSNSALVTVSHATEGLRLGANGGTGTVNLNGGTIQASLVSQGTGSGTFNFNGGMLKAAGSSATFMQGLSAANVLAVGAIIDSTNFNITIAQDLLDGGGGLTKVGTGTLTLTGVNTYTGATAVNAGKLITSTASLAGGNYTVANSAGFGVKVLALNAQTIVSNLTLSPTSGTFDADLGSFGVNTAAPLVASNLTVNGTITVNVPTGLLPTGSMVPLLAYGTKTGTGTFTAGTLPPGVVGIISNNVTAKTIDLYVTSSGTPRWEGLANGNWDINVTTNWIELSTGNPTFFKAGNPVLFDDNATGTKDVVLVANADPVSTTFTNDSFNYTLSATGTNGISGSGGLAKWGTGSLSISNANTYSGGTTIGGGTLIVTDDNALGANSGLVTLGGGTLEFDGSTTSTRPITTAAASSISVISNVTAQLKGVVSGASTLTKIGGGTLVLSGNNVLTNAPLAVNVGMVNIASNTTTIGSGTLTVGSASATARLNLSGNSTLTATNTAFAAYAGNGDGSVGMINVASGSTLNVGATANAGGRIGYHNSSAGAIYNAGVLTNMASAGAGAGFFMGEALNAYGYIQNMGTLFINARLGLGHGNTGVGVVDVTGGTLTVAGTNQGANLGFQFNANGNGSSALNIKSGGTLAYTKGDIVRVNSSGTGNNYASLNVSGAGSKLQLTGTGSLSLNNNDSSSNVTTLSLHNGGELAATAVTAGGAAATNSLNFNNGRFSATAAGTLIDSNITAYVHAGGATIDTAGFDAAVNTALRAPVGDGATTYGVTSITLGGTTNGYVGAPVVRIVGDGQGAAAMANFDPAAGTITGITVTSPGSGYTTAPTVELLGGSGTTGTGAGAGGATATAQIGAITSGGLTKLGAGTLILNSVNTYTGATTVSNGALGGIGVIAGPVVVTSGGTLAPGASIGTLTISNNLNLAGGMAVEVNNTNAQTSDLCVVTGTRTNSGGGTIIVTNLGPALAVGNTFQLFNTNVVGGGSMTVTGGGAGVTWTNKLAIDGTIMVLNAGAVTPSPTLLTNSVVGGTNLALSWPAGQGWRLQSQVTNRAVGLNTNWVYITDTSVSSTNIAIDKTNGAVFYRLGYP